MSILWCGGEDSDFPNGSPVTTDGTATYFRSGYGRGSAYMATVGPIGISSAFPGGAVTAGWFSCRMYWTNTTNGVGGYGIGQTGTLCGIWLGLKSAGKLALFKYNGTTWSELAYEAGTSFTSSNLHKIDIQLTSFGSGANVKVYVDGFLAIDFTGDVTLTGFTGIDCIKLYRPGGTGYCWVSEIIAADEDSRPLSLVTIYPNQAGDSNAWTGAYTDIDESQINDADLVYSNVNNDACLVNLSACPAGTFAVPAVKAAARAIKSASSTPTKIALGIKTGTGTDDGSDQALTTSWATYERLMATDPTNGGAVFTTTVVDALQLQLKAKA